MGVRNPDLTQPFAEWQEVDVVFPSSTDTDVVVPHTLNPQNPEAIHYRVMRQNAAGHLYHSTAFDRKPWQPGYILLRSDVANVKMRLLLWTSHSREQLTF